MRRPGRLRRRRLGRLGRLGRLHLIWRHARLADGRWSGLIAGLVVFLPRRTPSDGDGGLFVAPSIDFESKSHI
jgi:hypothetical protein